MSEPIQEDVEKTLKRIEPELYKIVEEAWGDWLSMSEKWRTRFPRTRANWVWDRMINRAYDAFSQDENIKFIEQFSTVAIIIDNHVLFRFKKGDIKGLSRNYPTQLALAYHNHEMPLFPDMKLPRVEVVYMLNENETETQIDRICVVARGGNKILWAYDVKPQANAEETISMPSIQRIAPEDLIKVREEKEDIKITLGK